MGSGSSPHGCDHRAKRCEFLWAALGVLWVATLTACSHGTGKPSGGDGGAATFGDPTPAFTPDQAARACALAEACPTPPLATKGANCVYLLERAHVTSTGDLAAFAACAVNARDCTETLTCYSRGHGPDYCAAHPGSSCDGDLTVGCPVGLASPGWAYIVADCAGLGMKCIADGHCTDGKTCKGPIVLNCVDNRLTSCDLLSQIQSSVDCATIYPGGLCGAFNEDLQCLPPKAELCPWSTETPWACSDNILLGCDGPRASRLDCSALASDCSVDNMGLADCVPRAKDCTATSPDLCHGSALSICVDGHYRDVDCTSLGLGPCQATADGAACGAAS